MQVVLSFPKKNCMCAIFLDTENLASPTPFTPRFHSDVVERYDKGTFMTCMSTEISSLMKKNCDV